MLNNETRYLNCWFLNFLYSRREFILLFNPTGFLNFRKIWKNSYLQYFRKTWKSRFFLVQTSKLEEKNETSTFRFLIIPYRLSFGLLSHFISPRAWPPWSIFEHLRDKHFSGSRHTFFFLFTYEQVRVTAFDTDSPVCLCLVWIVLRYNGRDS